MTRQEAIHLIEWLQKTPTAKQFYGIIPEELLRYYEEQNPALRIDGFDDDKFCDRSGECGMGAVSSRTFQGFDEDGLLKITAKARTMGEAIQTAYDIFGDKVTIWNFKWLS